MKAKEVKRLLGITQQTLYNYNKMNKIKYTKLNNNHYEYDEDEVYRLIGKTETERVNIIYSRVSLPKQKEDLLRQIERLLQYTITKGEKIDNQYSDIKSGMNFERDGLNTVINRVINNEIDKIFVENKDRLTRFGFELLVNLFKKFGTEIVVVNNIDSVNDEQELIDDLLSIIHYFSMKSYSHRRQINKLKSVLTEA